MKRYIYTEDDFACTVEELEDKSDDKYTIKVLRIDGIIHQSKIYVDSKIGDTFTVVRLIDSGYCGCWDLEEILDD